MTGETFEVEYVYYILIILGLMALIIFLVSQPGRSRLASDHMALAEDARKRKLKQQAKEAAENRKSAPGRRSSPAIQRELARVPTPWGWPQYGDDKTRKSNDRDFSNSLHDFADRLVNEKRTVQDQQYMEKRNANMRALLEDRYGRASKMPEIPYRKVKAPLLRDPRAEPDQMDNFASGKGDQIVAKLEKQSGKFVGRTKAARRDAGRANLKNVKTPWGW